MFSGKSEHLSPVDETRDLGILMDSTMKFSMQCSKAANKAMQTRKLKELLNTLCTLWSFLILYKT